MMQVKGSVMYYEHSLFSNTPIAVKARDNQISTQYYQINGEN